MNRVIPITLLAATVALSACGRVGTLDQPAPLYGAKAKAKYQMDKEAAAAAKATKEDNGVPEPLPRDPRDSDPDLDLSPARTQPIEGQRPNLSGAPAPGVLPDPFNHPQ
ncbi:MAG TPA: hypothetical protein VFC47_02105 [Caulobacteraceae bacterium]|nr:hypothetical protein [Caulobacteraceae bacterium]